ncbi:helix-turn-helix domain-containing protein [Achromobacter sp. Bel]|uniref:helix-turn-helix domain-containing protein n=1 Tax=Achromobacter sp. Bel TaxID=2727415 RepID=UPI00145F95C5|nr:helix-turn-helix domain-containing protein [Achromobacter sp. Bel]NMK48756.1 helix-turn-helix domain-containing protein [Achromobacter sp. Bel]
MDILISNASRALAAGDPIGALNHVALRDDAPALALRGIAMAQLGDFVRAKALLRRAAKAFGDQDAAARARCVVAEAEVALASRDLAWPERSLATARATLQAHGDTVNAAHAAQLQARRQLLTGQPEDAGRTLDGVEAAGLPAASRAIHELIRGGIALRRIQASAASAALTRAADAARQAGIPALLAEVDHAFRALHAPAGRRIGQGGSQDMPLGEVEALLASKALIVDACRNVLRREGQAVSLASRPVLFTLARMLAEAWPQDVSREQLIAQAFRTGFQDESHRVRLRVEIGRLRAAMRPLASVHATKHGFVLRPERAPEVVVLARPVDVADRDQAAVLACLADGQAWSSSALALALGASQRTVQRALDALAAAGQVQPLGHGRARRWMTPPVPGFTTSLLLPLVAAP